MFDYLKLENQLCFPLYAASKEVVRRYKPFLDKLNLTYTQYIAMLVLWEDENVNVKELGEKLFLDSGTLTPLLKKLEDKGYIIRNKADFDERNLSIRLTEEGLNLKKEAMTVPKSVGKCINLSKEEALNLYNTLYKILKSNNS